QPKIRFLVDKEKAALHGISEAAVADAIQIAAQGLAIDLLHVEDEREDVPIRLELPRAAQAAPEALLVLRLRSERDPEASLIPLSELVRVEETQSESFL